MTSDRPTNSDIGMNDLTSENNTDPQRYHQVNYHQVNDKNRQTTTKTTVVPMFKSSSVVLFICASIRIGTQ